MNKIQFTAYMFLVWAAFCFGGCTRDNQMYLQAKAQDTAAGQEPEAAGDFADTDPKKDAGSVAEYTEKKADQDTGTICVYVCGAVKKPGVYRMAPGSRIYEAIRLAGGLKKNASVKGVNQAQPLSDADVVEILTMEEAEQKMQAGQGGAPDGITGEAGASGEAAGGLIDLNTATAAQLMTLNGIGEVKAANIIAYRESNGKFSKKEELMDVSGIGEGVYANIQDKITVTQ